MHRQRAAILVLTLALTACPAVGHQLHPPRTRPATPNALRPSPDPSTAGALVRIARAFNNAYDHNNDGPVYR
jgi:hypothetical protein